MTKLHSEILKPILQKFVINSINLYIRLAFLTNMRVLSPKSSLVKLDKKDRAIIAELTVNARQPLTSIAKKVLLSRKSVEYRIKQMEQKEILIGSRTMINIKLLGYQPYHSFIMLHSQDDEKILMERAIKASFVNAVISYSGKYALEISIMARNPEEFIRLYKELTSGINIHEDMTLLLLSTVKSTVMPEWNDEREHKNFTKQQNKIKYKEYDVDEKDIELLKLLSKDATTSSINLAEKLNISKDTVAYRIRTLLAAGYILDFRPVINFSTLGFTIHSIIIKINNSQAKSESFESFLKESDKILWASKTFGYYDYIIYAITEDISELHNLINKIKERFNKMISSYELLFAYAEMKYEFMADSVYIEKENKKSRGK